MTLERGFTLVTGASQGIGRAICDALSKRGQEVIGIARRPDPSFPGQLLLADLTDRKERKDVLESIAQQYDVLSLVNNAGFNEMQSLGEISLDAVDKIIELNVHCAIDVTQAVLPAMKSAAVGRIVNISSRSLLARPGGSVYSIAKSGLVGMTRSWALELADQGITVNCVAPGPVATSMFARNNPPGLARTTALLKAIPMGRPGHPQEIAEAVLYFLSPVASFTTGQTLFVCGGSSVNQLEF